MEFVDLQVASLLCSTRSQKLLCNEIDIIKCDIIFITIRSPSDSLHLER